MTTTVRPGFGRLILIGAALAALVGGAIAWRAWRRHAAVDHIDVATIRAATAPAATRATTPRAADEPKLPRSYIDVVKADYPTLPATQPLGVPVEYSQAAHLLLHEPIYLGGPPRAEMWISRPDAPPTEQVLKDVADPNKDEDVHVVRERVAFVDWLPGENGAWPPYLVCREADGTYAVRSEARGRLALPVQRDFHWEHALAWNDKVIVPSGRGVSVLRFAPIVSESYHELVPAGTTTRADAPFAEPRVLLAQQGVIAWMPWETGKTGGRGAAYYAEGDADDPATRPACGAWTEMNAESAGWPDRILHLVPLSDGTALLLAVDEHNAVRVTFAGMERAKVDEAAVTKAVDDLSDPDEKVRKAAYDRLTLYGPGIWPLLEKLMEDQGPEAQSRLRKLLKQRVQPTLNDMTLLGSKSLKLAARLSDGGTVFYAEAGVSIPNDRDPDAGPDYRVPAWISIRPGEPISLLPPTLTADLQFGRSKLQVASGAWIVTGDAAGARRFVGNGFIKLLRKGEQAYSELVGVDRRGRWLFRMPAGHVGGVASTATPATRKTASTGATSNPTVADTLETLVIDPTLPDPTPRLPVWVFRTAEQVGWDSHDWPVAKNGGAWALHDDGWVLADEKEPFHTRADEAPPPTEPAPAGAIPGQAAAATTLPASTTTATTATSTTALSTTTALAVAASVPASSPASAPATTAATTREAPAEPPILTDRDGNRYFGGLTDLRVVSRGGARAVWPLPSAAVGKGPAWLVRARDGRLFLFNQPGRILRLKSTPGAAEPFALEKTFTHNVPSVDRPTRIWLDPAGRIIYAWGDQLAIFFPSGYIPPAIAEKMLSDSGDAEE